MNDGQYRSVGDLEQNEFCLKSKPSGFRVPQRLIMVTKNWKRKKEIGELVVNSLCLDKQIAISERG